MYVYTNTVHIKPFKSFSLKTKDYCFIFLNLMTDYYFIDGGISCMLLLLLITVGYRYCIILPYLLALSLLPLF